MAPRRPIGLIERGWLEYAERILPKDAPPVQVQETRRAFYAGAIHLFYGVLAELTPDHEPTDADLAAMDALHHEIVAWGARLAAGEV